MVNNKHQQEYSVRHLLKYERCIEGIQTKK